MALEVRAYLGGVVEPDAAVLIPPSSRWGRKGRFARWPKEAASGDDRVLARVRALLAKAESTEFPDEAEALLAKAQALISRHAIDRAAVAGETRPGGGAAARRR